MTAVAAAPRERCRRELAEVLERDVAELTDAARLLDDLALDSLAMMSLFVWLESRGVTVATDHRRPANVADVLCLLEKAATSNLSIRIVGRTDAGVPEAADVVAPRTHGSQLAPVLKTPTFRLTPIEADDINFLYALAVHPRTCYRWRYRGAPPSVDRFVADLWVQVLVQLVARRATDSQPVGHLVCYGAESNRRHAYVGAIFQPEYIGTGMAAQAAAAFVRYLFHTFPMNKLYMEVPGYNWPQVSSGEGQLFHVEGVLRDHDYYAGRSWDKYLCAIYRDQKPPGGPSHS